MSDAAVQIIMEIEAAFPALRTAPFEPIVNSEQGVEPALTAAEFADKEDWTKLDPKWLDESPDGWTTALCFLSDEAICFYIAAFMVADLKGALQRVEPTNHFVHGFDDMSRDTRIWPRSPVTWTEYATERWAHLTRAQARAVVHFLEWKCSNDRFGVEHGAAEALSAFWYKRAAKD